ncbi:MAG: hypothetical protein R3C62_19970 [Chloroflexota bacterium]
MPTRPLFWQLPLLLLPAVLVTFISLFALLPSTLAATTQTDLLAPRPQLLHQPEVLLLQPVAANHETSGEQTAVSPTHHVHFSSQQLAVTFSNQTSLINKGNRNGS